MPLGPETTEIAAELDRALSQWGAEADDLKNGPAEWTARLSHYSTRWMDGTSFPFPNNTVEAFREAMIKTAAIAINAIQSLDRQRNESGKPFYEEETGWGDV